MRIAKKMTRRRPKQVQEHTHLAIRVESYSATVSAGINPKLYSDHSRDIVPDDLILESSLRLEVQGVCTYPPPRANKKYEITFHTEDASKAGYRAKDIHRRDANNAPLYRKNRGELYAVYDLPVGLGLIEKRRGDDVWAGWVFVQPRIITNVLILLGQNQRAYLSISERRIERHRWIWHVSVQTSDPAGE
jgi:hypothetical protein